MLKFADDAKFLLEFFCLSKRSVLSHVKETILISAASYDRVKRLWKSIESLSNLFSIHDAFLRM